MESLLQDLRYGVRMLSKNWGDTLTIVLSLALGIGANTAIFSVVNAVLLRPLPYKDPGRLSMIWEHDRRRTWHQITVDPENLYDWQKRSRTLDEWAALGYWYPHYRTREGSERLVGWTASTNLFEVLGIEPLMGRVFLPEDGQPGNDHVLLLSHSCWQLRFASDPNIIGRAQVIDETSYTIIGVLPPRFRAPVPRYYEQPEVLSPLVLQPPGGGRGGNQLHVLARLRSGATLEQARAEMDTIARQLEQEHPMSNAGMGVMIVPISKQVVGELDLTLWVLLGVVVVILLIACANVAALLSVQAAAREKEIAIRMALGSSRSRLIRQLLTESVMFAMSGGTLGILLSVWGRRLLVSLAPGNIPRLDEISTDRIVLVFTLLISLLTAVVFGLAPAIQGSKPNLNDTLREGGQRISGGSRQRLRGFLVITEVALAFVLLIAAGLMIRSFWKLQRLDVGFNGKNVLTALIWLPETGYRETYRWIEYYQQLMQRVESLPGVKSVAMVSQLPISKAYPEDFKIEGLPDLPRDQPLTAEFRRISVDYFSVMEIPLLKGRRFTERDASNAPPVLIINKTMASRYWPNEDPIGKRVKFRDYGETLWSLVGVVVGVVEDAKYYGVGPADSAVQVYVPFLAIPFSYMHLVVRTAGDPGSLGPALRREAWAIDATVPVDRISTMEHLLADKISQPRFSMFLVGSFAALALLLGIVGVYGTINHSVHHRSHEVGIRLALGAQRGDILISVLGEGMALAFIGIASGVVVAFALTRVMAGMLYGVSATDPLTFVGVAALLGAVALLASYIPALRATKVDPVISLRQE